jgi:hypothetical protein
MSPLRVGSALFSVREGSELARRLASEAFVGLRGLFTPMGGLTRLVRGAVEGKQAATRAVAA